MKTLALPVPVIERAVRLRKIRVVKIARIKRVIERGGRHPIEHHVAHRQHIGIAREQHVGALARAPFLVKKPLQPLRIINSG